MFIHELKLIGFRNYLEAVIKFSKEKTIVIGKNAQGKTNLLEIVQILSLGKSRRASKDAELVNFDMDSAIIHALSSKEDYELKFALQIRRSGRRTLKINDVTKKPAELAQNILSVSFMVDDLNIVNGSPSLRRDWLDSILLQLSLEYKDKIKQFEKVLTQRNSFIRKLVETGTNFNFMNNAQREQLDVWDSMFLQYANSLIKARKELIERYSPYAEDYYRKISMKNSDSDEILSLNYLGDEITQEDLRKNLIRDFARMHTTIGPQRQDLEFNINDKLAASFASQGQKRSLVLALKLAELKLLKEVHGDSPILLLDDVLAELDEDRQDFLLDAVEDGTQVIITTTHLGKHLEKWSQEAQILEVEKGAIKETLSV